MPLVELRYEGAQPIEGYGPGFFRVGGVIHRGTMLFAPLGARPWGGLDDCETLVALADEIDVLLIGTGAVRLALPDRLREALEAAPFGYEAMTAPAACRTYNVLLAEGRRVAVALIPL